jgi:signal transduction histidine kinase
MRRKDGSRFFATVMTTALKDVSGELVGFSKVLRDTTEQKRAEDTLREAANRKDQFLAMLAHELRNPLGPIGNAIHMLAAMTPDNKDTARLTDIVKRQVTHMTRLIGDLLDVSRITRGKILLQKKRADLREVVGTAVEDHRKILEKRSACRRVASRSADLDRRGRNALVAGNQQPAAQRQQVYALRRHSNDDADAGCRGQKRQHFDSRYR